MNKIFPLIGVIVATIFAGRAAVQFSDLPITNSGIDGGKLVETRPKASSGPQTARGDSSRSEPPHKALIHCLSDLDDLLDSIVNPATFVTVRPLLLSRVREHVAQASENPQGIAKLNRAASQELQSAMNRHTESMTRANKVAPGVAGFFEHEMAAVLNPK
jgi:hypothetical protein